MQQANLALKCTVSKLVMYVLIKFGTKPAFSQERLSNLYIICLYMDRLQVLTASLPYCLPLDFHPILSHRL